MGVPYGLAERCALLLGGILGVGGLISGLTGLHVVQLGALLLAAGVPAVILYTFMNVDSSTKAVLVTGCDSGFGLAEAKNLHELGFIVFAGCLFKDKGGEAAKELEAIGASSGRLHVVQLDVTSDEQVKQAAETVRAKLPPNVKGLWAVINNAGWSTFGEVEWVPLPVYEQVASINLFGLIRVTKAFLPLIREARGRVVNVASMLGRMGAHGRSPYCATKFGVEAFSDCLRLEMKRFNVDVIVIEPGNFIAGTSLYNAEAVTAQARRMWDNMTEDIRQAYGRQYFDDKVTAMLGYTKAGVSDISPVINAMTDAVYRAYPRCRYQPMSPLERVKISTATHLPEVVFDYIFG